MGNAFSNGRDNDELVDNLVDSGYIRSKKIQQVFRAVDRGDYFLSFDRDDAYKDFAWKHGNIHLSAPCIYCEVLEELALQPGQSFLNIGSGTGYLSTMAGLLLTQSGTNHGIELHEDCIKYAYDRLDEFKQKSLALDEFDFCEPVFVQGNCLSAVQNRRYDRVYCGATCPESHESVVKEFVKIGGILIMPYKDHLVRAKRINEDSWVHAIILPVSFASLIIPTSNDVPCHLPDCEPLPLQELCRGKIRRGLRQNVWRDHKDLEICKPLSLEHHRRSPPHRALRQFIIPIFEESDDDTVLEEDEVLRTQLLLNIDSPPGENLRTTLQLMRAVIQPYRTNNESAAAESNEMDVQEESDGSQHLPSNPHGHARRDLPARHRKYPDNDNFLEEDESPSTEDTNFSSERERQDSESSSDSACDKLPSESHNLDDKSDRNEDGALTSGLSAYSNMSESESEPEDENESEADAARCSPLIEQRQKVRRKVTSDSGIIEDHSTAGNDDASLSSDSEFANGTPVKHKRSSSSGNSSCSASSSGSNNNNDGNSNNNNNSSEFRRSRRSPIRIGVRDVNSTKTGYYTDSNAFYSYMKEKIDQLPLPNSLKVYVNYNRTL